MKKIFPLLALILFLTYSCKVNETIDYAILSGKIIGEIEGDELSLVSPSNRSFSKSISLSEVGNFIDTLRVDEGAYILHDGKNKAHLYIENGSEINIVADTKDFMNSLSISGKGSETSNYFLQKSKITNKMVAKDARDYRLDEEVYKAKFNNVKNTIEKVLDSITGIPENFKEKERRNLHYSYLKQLDKYEFLHSRYTGKRDFAVSEGFLAELNDVDYKNIADYNFSADYKDLVAGHFKEKAKALSKLKALSLDFAYLETFQDIQEEKLRDELLFDFSVSNIAYTKDLEGFYAAFMEISNNEAHKEKITESYRNINKLEKGNPSPKFVNYENYNGGTMSLDDFKGKYVYIDVWATWCGPCIGEVPSLKEIERKYQGKNIEIVSISVDKPDAYDKWREMIAEKELSGTQLLADKDFYSEFVQGYLINGIPRFILIDPNGDIVDSNAPRPSNPKLIELFNDLKI